MKRILKLFWVIITLPMLAGFMGGKDLIVGKSILRKIFGYLLIVYFILTAYYKPLLFYIGIGILVVCDIIFSILVVYGKNDETYSTNSNSEQESFDDSYAKSAAEEYKGIFGGLSLEAARKKYHILMKTYHPDNLESGDLEKSKKITSEYEEYCRNYK